VLKKDAKYLMGMQTVSDTWTEKEGKTFLSCYLISSMSERWPRHQVVLFIDTFCSLLCTLIFLIYSFSIRKERRVEWGREGKIELERKVRKRGGFSISPLLLPSPPPIIPHK
jgi:hypothetical protein